MSGDTWLVFGTNITNGGGTLSPGIFWPVIQSSMNTYSTELNAQSKTVAGVMDKFLVDIESTGAGVSVIGMRLNGVNTSLGASQTSGTTGKFEDLTHTATSAANDLLDATTFSGSAATGFGSMGGAHFVATTSEAMLTGVQGQNAWNYATTSREFTKLLGGYEFNNSTTTESAAQMKQRAVGTYTHLFCNITGNGKAGAVTVVIRKNGVDGANTLAIGSGASGEFQDTTHSDSIASGDLTCVGYTTANVGSTTFSQVIAVFSSTNHQWDAGSNTSGAVGSSGNTIFMVLAGQNPAGGQLTEANAQYLFRFGTTAQNLRTSVGTNSGTLCAENYRANGANGNQSASITAATTGYFEDATHTDTIASGDLGCRSRTSSTGANINELPHITMGTGISGETASIAVTFGGIVVAIAATNQDASHIATVFGGIVVAGVLDVEATIHGSIATVFGLFSQAVNATDLGASTAGIRQFWTF